MATPKGTGRSQRPGAKAKKRSHRQSVAKPTKRASILQTPTDVGPATLARIQTSYREQIALQRSVDRERAKTLSAYRARKARLEVRRGSPVKRLFAEGDSWFKYPLGQGVISQLEGLMKTPIANFAWPGAETRQLLALHERREIEKRLDKGLGPGQKFDVMLFSGGGNDIVGDQMCLFLNRYDPDQPPEHVISARFDRVLEAVMDAYRDLCSMRDALSPDTLIVGHTYDYAWATGKGACWLGPWLRPSLDYVRVPRGDLQHAVVTEMLKRFEAALQSVALAAGKFIVVPTHDTLHDPAEWDNELHPQDPGFLKIARKFEAVLRKNFGSAL